MDRRNGSGWRSVRVEIEPVFERIDSWWESVYERRACRWNCIRLMIPATTQKTNDPQTGYCGGRMARHVYGRKIMRGAPGQGGRMEMAGAAHLCGIPVKSDIAGVDFQRLATGDAHQQRAVRRCADRPPVNRSGCALHGDGSAQADQRARPAGMNFIRRGAGVGRAQLIQRPAQGHQQIPLCRWPTARPQSSGLKGAGHRTGWAAVRPRAD